LPYNTVIDFYTWKKNFGSHSETTFADFETLHVLCGLNNQWTLR